MFQLGFLRSQCLAPGRMPSLQSTACMPRLGDLEVFVRRQRRHTAALTMPLGYAGDVSLQGGPGAQLRGQL